MCYTNWANHVFFRKQTWLQGFWHIQLDEPSSLLTTFQTCFGRYRWLRLPFGTSVSSEIFAKKLLEALDGLPGVICIADDIVIHAKTEQEHDSYLEQFLTRCRETGIKLNKGKFELRMKEISFMGASHHLIRTGSRPTKKDCDHRDGGPTEYRTAPSIFGNGELPGKISS